MVCFEGFFEKFLEHVLDKVRERLFEKGEEYAKDNDRLRIFRLISHGTELAPEAICMILADKHWCSLKNAFIPQNRFSDPLEAEEFVNEKALDVICYMILLYALIEERCEAKGIFNRSFFELDDDEKE